MERKQIALTAVVCLAVVVLIGLATVPAVADHDPDGELHYSFEGNVTDRWTVTQQDGSSSASTTTLRAVDGNQSMEMYTETGETVEIQTNKNGIANKTWTLNFSIYPDASRSSNTFARGRTYVGLTDGVETVYIGANPPGSEYLKVWGSVVNNAAETSSGEEEDKWRRFTVESNGTHIEASTDDGFNTTTTYSGNWSNVGDVSVVVQQSESGSFSGEHTYAQYDDIELSSSLVGSGAVTNDSEDLELDVKPYMKHGQKQEYSVRYNDSDTWTDVTGSATVESEDPDVVRVYQSNQTLVATSNVSVNQRVYVNATYNNLYTEENVTVANNTVENLDILPGFMWKFNAVVNNDNVRVLLVALMAAVVATKYATAFTGIGAFVIVSVVAWTGDYYGTGPMIVSVLFGIMVGLNLALNVDRSLR